MRILIVVNSLEHFPPQRLGPLLAACSMDGDVHLAAPLEPSGAAPALPGVTFHAVAIPRRIGAPWRELASMWQLWRLYRELQPQLIHHITAKPIIYGGLAARFLGIPAVVATAPGLGTVFSRRGPLARLLRAFILGGYRRAMAHPHAWMIVENAENLERLVRAAVVRSDRIVKIHLSGVDPEAFRAVPEPGGPPVVLFASRLLWNKGVGELVEAARLLRADGVDARFVLVGAPDPGNPATIPASQLQAWVAEGVAEWWGRRDDMPAVFASSHICCLPSYYGEGVPRFLIEGAACGRPLVTTDSDGCREIVHHEVTGLLVPPRDVTALAAALRRLIEQPALRARLGAAARERALAEYSAQGAIEATARLYRDLLATPPGGARPGGGLSRRA